MVARWKILSSGSDSLREEPKAGNETVFKLQNSAPNVVTNNTHLSRPPPQHQTPPQHRYLDCIDSATASRHPTHTTRDINMAEGTPTFKLVLVGDGGTGKVGQRAELLSQAARVRLYDRAHANTSLADHLRQAPFDRRVREEVHRNSRRRSPPTWLHNRK